MCMDNFTCALVPAFVFTGSYSSKFRVKCVHWQLTLCALAATQVNLELHTVCALAATQVSLELHVHGSYTSELKVTYEHWQLHK
jgi:hypothetical protein